MRNLIECFEITVESLPSKIAATYRNDFITFEELRHSAKQYAAAITEETENRAIGVFVNRGIATIEWIIGILYSHNYYIPIDPEMPIDKMRLLFEDAGLNTVICDACNMNVLEHIGFQGRIVTSESVGRDLYCDTASELSDPAYMIYTSGSTGKPKGVLKSHGSILSFIDAYTDTFSFSEEDVIGNQTPLYFDAAAKDLFLMMKTGATLVMIPTELFSGTMDLVEYMNEKKITACSWVPTALSLVAQMCPFSVVKPIYLKKMFFVGEVMPMKHLNKWRTYLPEVQYVNLYGQSELAGICCYYIVNGEYADNEVLPMGVPLKNSRVYIMDNDYVVTVPNHVGELYIVSDALAMEYYHDPEKTSSSFLMKDFGNGLERCFKTGDLAQYDTYGNLIFAARTDYQIKHMGRRIELGEIETIAGAIAEIDRCCCLYNAERKKIVLFCQLVDGCTMSGNQIRGLIKPQITSYMLPNKVVIMEKIPINANGKMDRQLLKTMM